MRRVVLLVFLLCSMIAITLGQGTWTSYSTTNGLISNDIKSVCADSQGNIWFGTVSGVSKYNGSSWTNYTSANSGLAYDYVWKIIEDSQGNMWFATMYGLNKLNGSTWTTYMTANGLAGNNTRTLMEDSQGNIWIGTSGFGVSKYSGSSWTTYNTTNSSLLYDFVQVILEDGQGDIWFGTSNGVSCLSGSTWTNYSDTTGLGTDSYVILSGATDTLGGVWFGSDPGGGIGGGVNHYDGTSWSYYTTANGLGFNDVQGIACDSRNKMWFACVANGASIYNGSSFTIYTASQGLTDNNVQSVDVASNGDVWFGTADGASKLVPVKFNSVDIVDVTCNSTNNGIITINASAVSPPLQYSVDNGTTYQSSNVFDSLTTGTYHIKITDEAKTISGGAHTIGEIIPTLVNLGNDTSISISDTLFIDAGVEYYTYLWDNGVQSQKRIIYGSVVGAGTYTYFVTVTDSNSCQSSDTVVVAIVDDSGINTFSENVKINIYPNPTENIINIDINNFENSFVNIEVYNNLGIVLFDKKVNSINNNINETLDLSSLAKGSYFISIRSGNSRIIKKLLIM